MAYIIEFSKDREGHLIPVIKSFRQHFRVDLRTAKNMIESGIVVEECLFPSIIKALHEVMIETGATMKIKVVGYKEVPVRLYLEHIAFHGESESHETLSVP